MSTTVTAVRCQKCGQESGVRIPRSAYQPLLDQLAYSNPATLSEALHAGETVMVQCRANVGALVGTDERVLIIKRGVTHEFAYPDITDIRTEKVGWLMNAVCQLVTPQFPYHAMKHKAADESPHAVSLVRPWMQLFEIARQRIFDIRDVRRCGSCGAFLPIASAEWAAVGRRQLEAIPNGGAEVLAANMEPDEHILAQVHGERYHKTLVVTDRRVMFVIGRSANGFHPFPLTAVEGVEVTDSGLQLRLEARPFKPRNTMELVTADDGMPASESDRPRLVNVQELIASLL